ncbi:MAG: hypothetical protein DDG60_05330 [Anaerolineae bacterium]|nr:MAG: hypothetical protein DDG60_05330 [Anaerolineae bacterium]
MKTFARSLIIILLVLPLAACGLLPRPAPTAAPQPTATESAPPPTAPPAEPTAEPTAQPAPAAPFHAGFDYNGDGRSDVAVFTKEGWQAALSTGVSFDASGSGPWTANLGMWGEIPFAGDFNGDGKTDVAVLNWNGELWVGLSTGSSFDGEGSGLWASPAGQWGGIPLSGDFDGDGRDDVLVFTEKDGLRVGLSTGRSFDAPGSGRWNTPAGLWSEQPFTGDFNGDGKDDMGVLNWQGQVWVGLSSGSGFDAPGGGQWTVKAAPWGGMPLSGDFDGDGKTDVAVFTPENQWKVNLSSGSSFDAPGSGDWLSAAGLWGELPTVGDFDGDGRADIAMLNGNSEWWLGLSSGSSFDYPIGSGRWQSATGKWCDVPLNAPDFWRFDHLTPNMQNIWEGRFRLAGCGQ